MSWTWEPYRTANGEIPQDLLAFLVELIPVNEFTTDLPLPVLTPSESGARKKVRSS